MLHISLQLSRGWKSRSHIMMGEALARGLTMAHQRR